ncbi:hypothetical protein HanPI659440_Chr14g0573211 [Helianthus annuus]|nr:hypothetical protein HanPI659440_Chr14g0573211 [Helianthus annuus]
MNTPSKYFVTLKLKLFVGQICKISSMIEIEVEMDSDVLAAESASNAETIAEHIEHIMEIENLEERWRIQAEANDEVEKLLNSEILPSQQVSDI